MATTKNPCTKCGAPGLPGLIPGAGKCQRHWNLGVWGYDASESMGYMRHPRPGPLTTIAPGHRFCLLDDGMGNLARVPLQAFIAASYYANSGQEH